MSLGYNLQAFRLFPPSALIHAIPVAPPGYETYPGPLLAHCGRWWPIASGQVACGACGVTYTEKADSA